jgi:hypothetical protein
MLLSLSDVPDMGSRTTRLQIKPTQSTVVVKTASYGLNEEKQAATRPQSANTTEPEREGGNEFYKTSCAHCAES